MRAAHFFTIGIVICLSSCSSQSASPSSVAEFKDAMLQFADAAKALADLADTGPELAEFQMEHQKLRALFDRVPSPPTQADARPRNTGQSLFQQFKSIEVLLQYKERAGVMAQIRSSAQEIKGRIDAMETAVRAR